MLDPAVTTVASTPRPRGPSIVDLADTRRQVILGSVLEASIGDRVAVLAPTLAEAQQLFTNTLGGLDLEGLRVSHLNGRQSLGFPNRGRILYESLRGSSRGRSYDVVYAPRTASEAQLAEILPTLDTSPNGTLYLY